MLRQFGWRVGIIWECAIKGKTRISEKEVIQDIIAWLKSEQEIIEIHGLTR